MATALCAAITIEGTDTVAPEWLHLLPAGAIRTVDGRGPYRVADVAALMSASIAAGKLTLDVNHATDLAAPQGQPAPAQAWIVELQARADGVWGRVDWIDSGTATPVWRQYRGVSPVIAHRKDGTIMAILRASLTNTPNFAGLRALHSQEKNMELRDMLIEALGLDSAADDAAIMAALKVAMNKEDGAAAATVAMQAALAPIARAAGLAETADAAAVLAGVQRLKVGTGDGAVVAGLQSELATVTTRLNTMIDDGARKDATAFVDAAIAAGRVGVKPMRDRYISMHMADAPGTAELINAMPAIKSGASFGGVLPADAKDGLGEADAHVIALMGIDRAAYAATHAETRQEVM